MTFNLKWREYNFDTCQVLLNATNIYIIRYKFMLNPSFNTTTSDMSTLPLKSKILYRGFLIVTNPILKGVCISSALKHFPLGVNIILKTFKIGTQICTSKVEKKREGDVNICAHGLRKNKRQHFGVRAIFEAIRVGCVVVKKSRRAHFAGGVCEPWQSISDLLSSC